MDSRLREHAHAKAHRFYLQKGGFKLNFHEFLMLGLFGWRLPLHGPGVLTEFSVNIADPDMTL